SHLRRAHEALLDLDEIVGAGGVEPHLSSSELEANPRAVAPRLARGHDAEPRRLVETARAPQRLPQELELVLPLRLELEGDPIAPAARRRHRTARRHAPLPLQELRFRLHVALPIAHQPQAHALSREGAREHRGSPGRTTPEASPTGHDLLDDQLHVVLHGDSAGTPGGYSSRISQTTSRRSSSEVRLVTTRVPVPRHTTAR